MSASSSQSAVVVEPDDRVGPPRRNGELVFEAPWQGRAFAMCMAILTRQGLAWDSFRKHLVEVIARHPDADYYDCFAEALEVFVGEVIVGAESERPR